MTPPTSAACAAAIRFHHEALASITAATNVATTGIVTPPGRRKEVAVEYRRQAE
jgi:hypothetical protein